MVNLKETLKSLDGFVENEYLDKYVVLVERHYGVHPRKCLTNRHHIIPKAWFKLNDKPINNDPNNLVTLPYREHVLAHYYLCLCTKGGLLYANELALECLLSRKKINEQNKKLIESLPLYNTIYKDFLKKKKSNYKLY
jgi:hypothetical protein